jgi:23S rRNA (adenine2503-C2)-methyltransferase
MSKINIKDLSKAELEEGLSGLGEEGYRARQIFRWLYGRGVKSFDEMTDLGSALRNRLKKNFHISKLIPLDSKRSDIDGTVKYLFRLEDSNTIETVLLAQGERKTLCLSSQVGCKFGCRFCASAAFGFVRNLNVSEILDEVLAAKEFSGGPSITNVVFMGIGEPLDNYENVLKSVRILNDRDAFGIGARRITISTCGIIPGIERLRNENLQVELSVSLHAGDDRTRSKLVPVNKVYPLKDLIKTCRDYINATGRVITFEYVLIKGLNSSKADAVRLAALLKDMKCKVNIISHNRAGAMDYEPPSPSEARLFIRTLREGGMSATRRKSKGEDIDAGCGQLRISSLC